MRVTFFQQRAFFRKMMSENINPALISHDMLLFVNMAFKTQGTGGGKFYTVTATEALISVRYVVKSCFLLLLEC